MKIVNNLMKKLGYIKLESKEYPIALCSLKVYAGVNHDYHAMMLDKYCMFPVFIRRIAKKDELRGHSEIMLKDHDEFVQYFNELQARHMQCAGDNNTIYNPYKNAYVIIPAVYE